MGNDSVQPLGDFHLKIKKIFFIEPSITFINDLVVLNWKIIETRRSFAAWLGTETALSSQSVYLKDNLEE